MDKMFLGKKGSGKNVGANAGMPVIPLSPKNGNVINIFQLPGSTTLTPIYFGNKNYELSDWLGNVRVVINDRKTPVNTGNVTLSYIPQMLSITDYYSFGSEIFERTYSHNVYRFGFNGKEDLHEQRWYQDYGARFYNKVLGRFVSADPLIVKERKYAWLSSYQFASNRPIDGIDLDGKEYLKSSESRIEIVNGEVKLKVNNFLSINQKSFENANNNPQNWRSGEIGINTTIGKVQLSSFLDQSFNKGNPNSEYPDKAPSVSPTIDDANPTIVAPGGSRTAASFVGLVNAINFGIEQYAIWTAWYDIMKIEEYKSILKNQIEIDIDIAFKQKLISRKYQNPSDIGNIMNVILQGENKTENKEIYEIGMTIWNKISVPKLQQNKQIPSIKKDLTPKDNTNVSKPRID